MNGSGKTNDDRNSSKTFANRAIIISCFTISLSKHSLRPSQQSSSQLFHLLVTGRCLSLYGNSADSLRCCFGLLCLSAKWTEWQSFFIINHVPYAVIKSIIMYLLSVPISSFILWLDSRCSQDGSMGRRGVARLLSFETIVWAIRVGRQNDKQIAIESSIDKFSLLCSATIDLWDLINPCRYYCDDGSFATSPGNNHHARLCKK